MSSVEDANVVTVQARPILLRPSIKLREKIQKEAQKQKRSLNNLVIIILEKYFKGKSNGNGAE